MYRSVFFGTPDFAVPILAATAEVTKLVAVVTQPDKPKGRGHEVAAPPTKGWAQTRGIPVLQPQKLRDGVLATQLRSLDVHVAVVAAYGRILPKDLLELPKFGCVNVHASLLPRYRGAAPIQWAIANGEIETGVTLMKMDEGLDTGDILATKATPIGPRDTGGSLHDKLAQLGAELVRESLPRYLREELHAEKQNNNHATLAPLLTKEHGHLDFTRASSELANHIRAFDPWPGTHTFVAPNRKGLLKVLVARIAERPQDALDAMAGTIVSLEPLLVATGDGRSLEIVEVQPEGKRRMTAEAFVAGRHVVIGQLLDPDLHAHRAG